MIIDANRLPQNCYATSATKRNLDIAISLPALIVSVPIIVFAAIVILINSPGAPILAQKRVGRHRVNFTCYKLRTMHEGTRSVATHEAPASAVTSVGRFLRKAKLDELPQLWNVLRGDMSLIGPRPCLPTQNELVAAREHLGVFHVRPGISGLAQVNGIDMSQPLRLADVDARYVETATLVGDLRLLVATIWPRAAPPLG